VQNERSGFCATSATWWSPVWIHLEAIPPKGKGPSIELMDYFQVMIESSILIIENKHN